MKGGAFSPARGSLGGVARGRGKVKNKPGKDGPKDINKKPNGKQLAGDHRADSNRPKTGSRREADLVGMKCPACARADESSRARRCEHCNQLRTGRPGKPGAKKKTLDWPEALASIREAEGLSVAGDAIPKHNKCLDVKTTTEKLTKQRPSILDVRQKAKKALAILRKPVASVYGTQSPTASTSAALACTELPSPNAVKCDVVTESKKGAADKAHDKRSLADNGGRDETDELCPTSPCNTAMQSPGTPGSGQSAIGVSSRGTSRIFYICAAVFILTVIVLVAGIVVQLLPKKYTEKQLARGTSVKVEQSEARALTESPPSYLAVSVLL